MNPPRPRIGVALSGGGFRAAAFGLGCCRALHDTGLLSHVKVISGISGGGLLAALYAYGPADFDEFDAMTVDLLRRGLQAALIRRTFTPTAVSRNLLAATRTLLPRRTGSEPRLRTANRTDALRDELTDRAFGDRTLDQVRHPTLATVLTATDLRTSNAVRFGSLRSSCSAYGTIVEKVTVAEAVAASAAFPLLLPAMERTYTFTRSPGTPPERRAVSLTDGGIYDNLGLSVLEPQRSTHHTPHVYDVDYVISCDAGRGSLPPVAGHFAGTRLRRSFDTVHRRSQDASRAKLHAAASSGLLKGVVHAYLGMPDERLPVPVPDLVPASRVRTYPTNFRAMSAVDIELITMRAEQLTRVLISHYCSELA
ncbi:patatin-like phospholipase family protein [Amycolatopsis pigmentata]|uniref:Patatin-like phospholipase family protein n=1 Tax=Amycolatopsis pigmentata TaxID=450801 RepID=A0ABW5G3V3_9PSEU